MTTATHIDAGELAQTYIRRWPLQENVIRDYLLPLGLDINHGYGKTPVPNSERNRLQAEAEREMQALWQRVSSVLETSNKEFRKWERYCREQEDLLRALEDLTAHARTMFELDNRKDRIMTVCKLALANLAMWTRDQCFPASYAHATWARLAPFFQLPGSITSSPQMVSVQLRPFHDRQYNRDLSLLCQRVNEKQLHLLDGRLLLFQVQELTRPILHQQQRLNA